MTRPPKNAPLSVALAATPQTISEALTLARAYWESKGASSRMMPIRAQACATWLGGNARKLSTLSRADGTKLLTSLAGAGLSKSSIQAYYAAFRRALALAGVSTVDWPKAGTPPRKVRDPISEADLDRLEQALKADRGYNWGRYRSQISGGYGYEKGDQTVNLLELLRGTGMRVDVEALSFEAYRVQEFGALREDGTAMSAWLKITGKGGHERVIPVTRPGAVTLLQDKDALDRMRRLSYSGHLKRWNKALERLERSEKGIKSRLPTPHAVRHHYATEAWKRCKDLVKVQHLLGHADVATTAGYIGVDLESLREAVG